MRHTKTIENIYVQKRTEAGAGTGAMLLKKDPGAGATLMKTKGSAARAWAKFMKWRARKSELCPFYGDFAALLRTVRSSVVPTCICSISSLLSSMIAVNNNNIYTSGTPPVSEAKAEVFPGANASPSSVCLWISASSDSGRGFPGWLTLSTGGGTCTVGRGGMMGSC